MYFVCTCNAMFGWNLKQDKIHMIELLNQFNFKPVYIVMIVCVEVTKQFEMYLKFITPLISFVEHSQIWRRVIKI